ncbi:MAG: DEAD/DEAH box helicase [Firmicutes bacterium]|jgi:SNF2 family DNA or RNA helicase|nr:DEAD/DEAH box helicase [Bacillota bacterium]
MSRLKIECFDKRIVISGNITEFYSIPYMRIFLNEFDALVESDLITINYSSDEEFIEIYKELNETIIEEGFIFEVGENIGIRYNDFLSEEDRFNQFSKEARDIRENKIEKDSFEDFITTLDRDMINRKLYRLQYLSAFHLAFSQNACNFSVPGAGKTSIVYGAYSYLRNLEKENSKFVDKILVICPISAFGPWIDEYESCYGVKPNCMRISGEISQDEKKSYFYSMHPKELTLISYHSTINLKKDLEFYLKNNNVLVVLDEAHKIKNTNGGIIASTIMDLAEFPKAKFVLTGTPMPNSYKDLYNIFKFIWPTKDIVKYNQNQLDNMTLNSNDERIPDLIDNVKPFFIRIRKNDLSNMPVPIENEPVKIEMGFYQRQIYSFISSKIKYDLDELAYSEVKKELVKAKLVRLMQVASNPYLLANPVRTLGVELDFEVDSFNESSIVKTIENYLSLEIPPKYVATHKLVEKIKNKGEKVVIWTTYIGNLNGLKDFLNSKGINTVSVYGETPIESDDKEVMSREQIIKEFKSNDEITVLVTNPFAVAESISLHKECHNAIYFERTFNAAHFIQSKDRIHRYGLRSTDEINYYYLVTEDSIDEKIHEVLKEKERRMREVIESEEIPLFRNLDDDAIDDETLLNIMRNYDEL